MGHARENLSRCNMLTSLLYPSYVDQGPSDHNALAMSRPPLIRLKYANLVDGPRKAGLLGYITSCDWQPVLEMGVFSTGNDQIYPKAISMSISFQVIHEVTPGYGSDNKKLMGGSDEFPFNSRVALDDILGDE